MKDFFKLNTIFLWLFAGLLAFALGAGAECFSLPGSHIFGGVIFGIITLYNPFNALTAYLSTTLGGRTAVVSLAFTIGADTTAVLAI